MHNLTVMHKNYPKLVKDFQFKTWNTKSARRKQTGMPSDTGVGKDILDQVPFAKKGTKSIKNWGLNTKKLLYTKGNNQSNEEIYRICQFIHQSEYQYPDTQSSKHNARKSMTQL